jgi:hypothetical protein
MIRKILIVIMFGVSSWVSTSHAALIGACTFSGGCGPDFTIAMTSIGYDYTAGSNTGVLSINGTVGNASFTDGQLDDTWVNTAHGITGNPYGSTSLGVFGAPFSTVGNDLFSFQLQVDGSGNVLGSNMTMNGLVGVFDSGMQTAISSNGTLLDGNLITGGTISQIGWDGSALDFLGNIDSGSLLTVAGYRNHLGGILTLNSISTGTIVWNEDWTASASLSTLDVVVPVPAAFWLFVSGLAGLISITRKKTI